MAKQPPKKSEDSGGDWLNTYADMVTLLLTFFVLLFACSNLDETKLQFIYQAFQSRGKYINPVVTEVNKDPDAENEGGVSSNKPEDVGGEGDQPQTFDQLYVYLADYIDKNNLSDSVSVDEGAAHLTIRFNDNVFFDGGSHILKPEGRETLNGIIPSVHALRNLIRTVTVTGHTADDGSGKLPSDFQLSANRAFSVLNHLMSNNMVEYEKYFSKSCGPNQPYVPNDSVENMAKNRRVEITLLKNELDLTDPKVIEDLLKYDYQLDTNTFDPDGAPAKDPTLLPEGSADKIISSIKDKYENERPTESVSSGPTFIKTDIFVAEKTEEKKS